MDRFQMHQYGIHHFDILAQWLGRQPTSVFAHTTRRPDQRYRGDMLSSVTCTYDEESQAHLQETNALHHLRPWATPLKYMAPRAVSSRKIWTASASILMTGAEGEHHQFAISWFPDAFAQTMAELIRAIAENRQPSHSAASTLPTLATVDAAYASAKQGVPVQPATVIAKVSAKGSPKGSTACLTNC